MYIRRYMVILAGPVVRISLTSCVIWIRIYITIHIMSRAIVKTIQMTIDEPLLAEVDRVIGELHTTRSAFIREALEAALRRHAIRKLEQQHAQGYAQHPVKPGEFDMWTDEQHWGAE
jgi:Arc/MetJ family transcription regulator